jgi:hypothetical protein
MTQMFNDYLTAEEQKASDADFEQNGRFSNVFKNHGSVRQDCSNASVFKIDSRRNVRMVRRSCCVSAISWSVSWQDL